MRRQVWLLSITLFLIFAAFFATLFGDQRPQLGLDLQGGVSVVLFPVKGSDLSTLNTAVQIITNRVDALGVAEPEVNRQGNTIVINLPGAKNRSQALALVGKTAELQFRWACANFRSWASLNRLVGCHGSRYPETCVSRPMEGTGLGAPRPVAPDDQFKLTDYPSLAAFQRF